LDENFFKRLRTIILDFFIRLLSRNKKLWAVKKAFPAYTTPFSSRAGIGTKLWSGDMIYHMFTNYCSISHSNLMAMRGCNEFFYFNFENVFLMTLFVVHLLRPRSDLKNCNALLILVSTKPQLWLKHTYNQ
jgi:hypothetical protein